MKIIFLIALLGFGLSVAYADYKDVNIQFDTNKRVATFKRMGGDYAVNGDFSPSNKVVTVTVSADDFDELMYNMQTKNELNINAIDNEVDSI